MAGRGGVVKNDKSRGDEPRPSFRRECYKSVARLPRRIRDQDDGIFWQKTRRVLQTNGVVLGASGVSYLTGEGQNGCIAWQTKESGTHDFSCKDFLIS
jgi:hypothetical protein